MAKKKVKKKPKKVRKASSSRSKGKPGKRKVNPHRLSTAMVVGKKANIISNKSKGYVAALFDTEETKAIAAEHAGSYVQQLGYRLVDKQGNPYLDDLGNLVEKLSYIGIKECARASFKFKFGEPKETFLQDKSQWVVKVEATNLATGENAWGGAQVDEYHDTSKTDGRNKINKFAYASAITKAQRNALKKLNRLEDELKWFAVWKQSGHILDVVYDRQEGMKQLGGGRFEADRLLKASYVRCKEIGVDKDLWREAAKIEAGVDSLLDASPDWLKEREHVLAIMKGDQISIDRFKQQLLKKIKEGKKK